MRINESSYKIKIVLKLGLESKKSMSLDILN